ncbi:Peroxidase [Mycena chlorophos]|uniref:Peroxidase n=1 Tax=Mycena chlorophos TaxID=658473 RepID=A0A8H6W5K2_MYCCL|nr:Peroxidase [Mycena chlorophos]
MNALAQAAILLAVAAAANAYTWPSPQLDALESFRYDQLGFNGHFVYNFIDPCTAASEGTPTGRSTAADWIRTAYHDMATHNVTAGTGGMDASIRFAEEQARPENVGDAFSNTLNQLLTQANRYMSIADVLSVAAIAAIENCGGPDIAFRGGRIDASEPNAPGVPQPQDDLPATVASFARQGFTQTEMIGLVACGHTFGGVQHSFFPNTVPAGPNNTDVVSHFDTTYVTFDNNIATEYISGTTQNPLVVGANDTTNSDGRIFGSDGNATMAAFAASADLYASTCADLIARMVDTVPDGVTLTEVITPLPVKPDQLVLSLTDDTLAVSGQVRFWNQTEEVPGIVVSFVDHAGEATNTTLAFKGLGSAKAGKYTSGWYAFGPIALDAVAGLASLKFDVGGVVEDQGGVGFAIADTVVFSTTSCAVASGGWRLDVAVRTSVNVTRLYMEQISTDSTNRVVVVETDIPAPAGPPVQPNAAYAIWSLALTDIADEFEAYDVAFEVDGGTKGFSPVVTWPGLGSFPPC